MIENQYYFKPTQSALYSEQVERQMGFNPDLIDQEVLRSYGLYPIREEARNPDPLENPTPVYEDRGSFFLKKPSQEEISLEEAKYKAKYHLIDLATNQVNNLFLSRGMTPELGNAILSFSGNFQSKTLRELKSEHHQLVENYDSKSKHIEEATTVSQIRQTLDLQQ